MRLVTANGDFPCSIAAISSSTAAGNKISVETRPASVMTSSILNAHQRLEARLLVLQEQSIGDDFIEIEFANTVVSIHRGSSLQISRGK